MKVKQRTSAYIYFFTGILLVGGLSYVGYKTHIHIQNLEKYHSQNTETFNQTIKNLEDELAKIKEENTNLNNILTEEQKKVIQLEKTKKKDARKINELEKLTTIDPELLKKYSKVFFLSENYTPPDLEDVEIEFKINPDKNLQILEDVEPYLHRLLKQAQEDEVDLKVISAHRSFDEQKTLKSNYTTTYGSGANVFSADQGYSEHQLGTTIDFGTTEITGAYMSFEKTPAFTWLKENAHEHGFILSYPKGNSYYQYEPWHWRFVGEDLAEDLFEDGKEFYELDQREIDEYLVDIFD
jgi:LAS superfamily LD-carboxypeptidase LdcB